MKNLLLFTMLCFYWFPPLLEANSDDTRRSISIDFMNFDFDFQLIFPQSITDLGKVTRHQAVANDLKLTKDEEKQLDRFREKYTLKFWERKFGKDPKITPAMKKEFLQNPWPSDDQAVKEMTRILGKQRLGRLKQLLIQRCLVQHPSGVPPLHNLFHHKYLQGRLGISAKQVKEFDSLYPAMLVAKTTGEPAEPSVGSREWQKIYETRVFELLTEKQQTKLRALAGRPLAQAPWSCPVFLLTNKEES